MCYRFFAQAFLLASPLRFMVAAYPGGRTILDEWPVVSVSYGRNCVYILLQLSRICICLSLRRKDASLKHGAQFLL